MLGHAGIISISYRQVEFQDLEKATVLAFRYALDSPELLKGVQSRQAFANFTSAVASAHPNEG